MVFLAQMAESSESELIEFSGCISEISAAILYGLYSIVPDNLMVMSSDLDLVTSKSGFGFHDTSRFFYIFLNINVTRAQDSESIIVCSSPH